MTHRMVLSRGAALLGALACLAAVSLTVPAAASASVTSLTSCQPITAPGTYRLDADVTANLPLSDCFDITASNVTLLLNGHTATPLLSKHGAGIDVEIGATNAQILGPGTVNTSVAHATAIELDGGNGSVRGVTASAPEGTGIGIGSSGNDVRGNVATTVLRGIGILIGPGAIGATGNPIPVTGNTLIGNEASDNRFGIDDRQGATGNTIIGNSAHNNIVAETAFDLEDENANCDSNVWRGNDFGTANQSCIH